MRVSLTLILSVLATSDSYGAERVDYARDIKPLLRHKCYACHGALKQQGGLRLDTATLARKGGDSGPAVEPGKSAASRLVERVTSADTSQRMPQEGEPLTAAQVALLQTWIDQGAAAPADEKPERDPRDHWAFRVPVRPRLPRQTAAAVGGNPIDLFIAAEQERRGLTTAPEAAKHLLLRRVYLDFVGLPPTREELHTFLADTSPGAYERIVDRLLASPRYGERWGRHWMDIWRYSDWYGRRMVPDVWNSAPQIWRWRDWIVRSLNDDKGYDRMIGEMLAADEIAPGDDDAAVATGYLIRNWFALNPNQWMRDNLEHTAKAFLGLTFNCAHCHDHKYDPITQRDYFAMRAFLEPIGIRQDRVPGEPDPGPFQEYEYSVLRKIARLGSVRIYDKNPTASTWFYTGGDERNRVKEKGTIPPGVPSLIGPPVKIEPVPLPPAAYYPGSKPFLQEALRADRRAAVTAAEAELAAAVQAAKPVLELAQAKLVAARTALASVEARIAADRAKFASAPPSLAGGADELAKAASRAEREAAAKQAELVLLQAQQSLAALAASAAADPKKLQATQQMTTARAALEKARAALADPKPAGYAPLSAVYASHSTGRRRALAEWIASPQNPLTARVAVNHIWLRHFQQPLVASVYDFGRNGALPTHPELLDWLAVEFMKSGWSMKHMHRLIVTSAAYRRASALESAVAEAADPDNRWLRRMTAGRMEAEVLRDSILFCAGNLDSTFGGQELENDVALATRRRSLYYSCQPEAGGKSELGALFDAADAGECYRRTRSIVPQQALALTNSQLIHEQSAALAERLWAAFAQSGTPHPFDFITAAYEQILTRPPSADERQLCENFLARQTDLLRSRMVPEAEDRARHGLIRVLFNHNDFLTIR
jgi:hypothetical protein